MDIPFFHPDGGYDYIARYPFGPSLAENLHTIATEPQRLIQLMTTPEKLEYLLETFMPLGGLSFIGFGHFLPALPTIFINLISPYEKMYSVHYHYGSRVLPLVYISAIYGLSWFIHRMKWIHWHKMKSRSAIAVTVIFFALSFISVPDSRQLQKYWANLHLQNFEKIKVLNTIPREASLCASYAIAAHVSNRQYIYVWEKAIGGQYQRYITEYVALDLDTMDLSLEVFSEIRQRLLEEGYANIYSGFDDSLHIFHNPRVNRGLVEQVSGIPGG